MVSVVGVFEKQAIPLLAKEARSGVPALLESVGSANHLICRRRLYVDPTPFILKTALISSTLVFCPAPRDVPLFRDGH